MAYRRPVVYIPPYNYCDRWCERCAIDKSRCLLYQTEMDERLHREIDGRAQPTPEETVQRMVEDAKLAFRLVEEQVREMGFDPEAIRREAGPEPAASPDPDPIVEEATALARALAAFLRAHGAAYPQEAGALRHLLMIPDPKLGRATRPAPDESGTADAILQAQVADRTLAATAAALESMRRRDSAAADGMIEILAIIRDLRREIARRWLDLPCSLLEPAPEGEWWGPLRDITSTLKHLRR